jgi:hypothetical protein
LPARVELGFAFRMSGALALVVRRQFIPASHPNEFERDRHSIPGPWLAVTGAGFAPARLCGIAKPQP